MVRRMFAPALAGLLLAGCGAGAASPTDKFSGEEKKVAQVIADLGSAGKTGDAGELCSRILSKSFVDELSADKSTCIQELDDALGDADDFKLDVQGVVVRGAQATAMVADGDGRRQAVELVRESRGWRVSGLS